jgi:hypothetical protein
MAYPGTGPYFVSISGDLPVVQKLRFGYHGYISQVSLQQLPGLKIFDCSQNISPATIDFSGNPQLEQINVLASSVTSFDVSNNPKLRSITISFNPNFSVASLNKIIDDVHQAVTTGNITAGSFNLQVNNGGPMIGPPSVAAVEKLRTLRDEYGWTITPASF